MLASCGIVQIHILFLVTTLPLFEGSKFSALQGSSVGVAPKVRQHGYQRGIISALREMQSRIAYDQH